MGEAVDRLTPVPGVASWWHCHAVREAATVINPIDSLGAAMSQAFDPDLVESLTPIGEDRIVEVYKIGGGTLGRSYEGLWGYRFTRRGHQIASGTDLHAGTPKTHDEVAQIILDIFDPPEQ